MSQLKRFCVLAVTALLSTVAFAQQETTDATMPTALFGYFSYSKALQAMPEMTLVKTKSETLRQQYDAEMKRVEEEFNKKYEEFLEGQRSFAPSIYKKRQAELTELMQKNIAFKEEARLQMAQAEADEMAPLKEKLAAIVAKIAKERAYAFVLNTDGDALPYVDTVVGEDITNMVMEAIKQINK